MLLLVDVTYDGKRHGDGEEGPVLGLPEAQPPHAPVRRLHVVVGHRGVVRAPRGTVPGAGKLQLGGIQLVGGRITIQIISDVCTSILQLLRCNTGRAVRPKYSLQDQLLDVMHGQGGVGEQILLS